MREFFGNLVCEGDAICREVDDFSAIFLDSRAANGLRKRFGTEYHARFATVRNIVHLPVGVDGEVSQIDCIELKQAFCLCAAHD